GAKNHMVVMPDAVMDKTAEGIIASAFGAAGQRCMAGSVVVAVGEAWDLLRKELVPRTSALRVGPGAAGDSDVGPVISDAAGARITAAVEAAIAEGARAAVDGRDVPVATGTDDGAGAGDAADSAVTTSSTRYVGPTILEGVDPSSETVREEIFGPVLAVVEVETLAEAIEVVNASRYGNGTTIFTESGAAARRYRVDVQAGMVGVNVGVAAPVAFFPFSGWKDSFFGDVHAHGTDAIDFYTRKKTVTTRWYSEEAVGRFFVE
ncbi:aldehyde dehydrogenase family protein, partial [Paraconexibacter sp.]|uniref:aldehyde dehydrogenase family protein n=1 Tax=Paraconexibacter sp. TaxID=2949640 RepID=UPI0035675D18